MEQATPAAAVLPRFFIIELKFYCFLLQYSRESSNTTALL